MADTRFAYLHHASKLLGDLEQHVTDDRLLGELRLIAQLFDENSHDLERFLDGSTLSMVGFRELSLGLPPGGNVGWQFDGDETVLDLTMSATIPFNMEFANGVTVFGVCFGDDPMNGATVVVDKSSVTTAGFDVAIYVGAVLQATGLYRVNWAAVGH